MTHNLAEQRRSIRHLLNTHEPGDAMAVYYAFYHPDNKTQLITYPAGAARAAGYVAISRTGIDLFRPLITLRFPAGASDAALEMIYSGIMPGSAAYLSAPAGYLPLLQAMFTIETEQQLRLYQLRPADFVPVINVLVTQAPTLDGLPRFVVRSTNPQNRGDVMAWAGLNWQSPDYAEIAVNTSAQYRQRGYGRSVVAALCQHVLNSGRQPLYLVSETNSASIQLAESLGFHDTGERKLLLEVVLRPRQ